MEKIIRVDGMMCEGCVKRISNALSREELNFKVILEEKKVIINGCDHCLAKAVAAIEDLGFNPVVE